MKNLYTLVSLLIAVIFIYSCDKYTDIHQEFISDGEKVYAPKPDSAVFIAGKGRVKLRLWMYNAVNVKNVIVGWNAGEDSLLVPGNFNTGRDSVDVLINNLPEKSYTFNIYSIDNFGHRSLYYTTFGSSFGDVYAASLINRRVKDLVITDQEGTINWYAPSDGMVYNEVRYTDKQGVVRIARMNASSFSLRIDVKAGTKFDYRSLYIPQKESVDTFYTAWNTYTTAFPSTYQYSKTEWEALEVSDETASDGGGKDALIDNNLGTYWHSQWSPSNTPLPHWAVIDMARPIMVSYFDIYRRSGNTAVKTVMLYQSNTSDPNSTSWVLVGQGVFASGNKLTVDVTNPTEGRYLKIHLPDSNNPPFTSVAEVYAFGN